MIFFGHVAVMLRASSIRPIPFIVSFTGYFIGLHVMEAICLRRLVAGASNHDGADARRPRAGACGAATSTRTPRAEAFNAAETIIGHVANSGMDHPLIHFPKVFGIDFSVTKHVFMLWLVATIVFVVVTVTVRRYCGRIAMSRRAS